MYNISLDTLRYYDRINLLKPIVDKSNGYRYYSLEHLDILEVILVGRSLEIPLEQMKEKIVSENIQEYMTMIEEQSQSIDEKIAALQKLKQYSDEMKHLLAYIQTFSNDHAFLTVRTNTQIDISVYQMNLKHFIDHKKTIKNSGIETFEQWMSYDVDTNGQIKKEQGRFGLSIVKSKDACVELYEYLKDEISEKRISKFDIKGTVKQIDFWGNENDLHKYLEKLCNHFHLKDTVLNLKYCFALLHQNMQHEYLVEIYF